MHKKKPKNLYDFWACLTYSFFEAYLASLSIKSPSCVMLSFQLLKASLSFPIVLVFSSVNCKASAHTYTPCPLGSLYLNWNVRFNDVIFPLSVKSFAFG